MSGEADAAGDVLTGAIIAGAIEGGAGKQGADAHGKCLNCGAQVDGAYCAACGQRTHLHRSLVSLGHDILHGVFHFEGKMWRTIPELFFHPGRLTRRYIDGERAKFVSPMALYLFTVFLMFGVFSFTTSNIFDSTKDSVAGDVVEQWKENNESAKERTDQKIEAVREQLKDQDLSAEKRATLEAELSDLKAAQTVMDALASGNWDALKTSRRTSRRSRRSRRQKRRRAPASRAARAAACIPTSAGRRCSSGSSMARARSRTMPSLAFYKLKIAGTSIPGR